MLTAVAAAEEDKDSEAEVEVESREECKCGLDSAPPGRRGKEVHLVTKPNALVSLSVLSHLLLVLAVLSVLYLVQLCQGSKLPRHACSTCGCC